MGFIIFLHLLHGERGTKQDTTRQELSVRKIHGLAKKGLYIFVVPHRSPKVTHIQCVRKDCLFRQGRLVVVRNSLHRHPTFLPVKIFTVNVIMDPPISNLKRFFKIWTSILNDAFLAVYGIFILSRNLNG